MVWNQDEFDKYVVKSGVISFSENEIKLKSGRLCNWYVNWRLDDAFTLNEVADYIIDFAKAKGIQPDTFYGVPEGMTRLGVLTQDKWAKIQSGYGPGSSVISMGRAQPKEHGAPKDKYFVGAPKGRIAVIEDVTTTGGSSLNTLDFLIESSYDVIGLIALTNRNEIRDDGFTVPGIMAEKGVKYAAMSQAINLLPLAAKELKVPSEWLAKTQAYTKQYCTQEIKLA